MRSTVRALGLLVPCLVAACGAASSAPIEEKPMAATSSGAGGAPSVAAKRRAPPQVPPVKIGDVRYEQARLGPQEAKGLRSGYLAAYKGDSDTMLWRVKVYDVAYDPQLEADVQDVWFRKMSVSPDGKQILIENEIGDQFAVEIAGDHAVHKLR
jgi:hypothetical protein